MTALLGTSLHMDLLVTKIISFIVTMLYGLNFLRIQMVLFFSLVTSSKNLKPT